MLSGTSLRAILPILLGIFLTSSCGEMNGISNTEELNLVTSPVDMSLLTITETDIRFGGLVAGERSSHNQTCLSKFIKSRGVTTRLAARLGYSELRAYSVSKLGSNILMIAGGIVTAKNRTPKKVRNTWLYNTNLNSISDGPSLLKERAFHSACRLNDGSLLIAGGDDVLEVERYTLTAKKWSTAGKLCSPREVPGILQVGEADVLLVGGMSQDTESPYSESALNSLEIFSLKERKGKIVGRMAVPRIAPDCVLIRKQHSVIIIGGSPLYADSEDEQIDSAEKFSLPLPILS
ncbi:MAG: hypothetical protein K2X27_28245 [Candidatus Obscuribacterales bacterium]|nr:hypothetical protein [Candidatus Obscuribacterales bacterium]